MRCARSRRRVGRGAPASFAADDCGSPRPHSPGSPSRARPPPGHHADRPADAPRLDPADTHEIDLELVQLGFERALEGDRPTMEQVVERVRLLHKHGLPVARR